MYIYFFNVTLGIYFISMSRIFSSHVRVVKSVFTRIRNNICLNLLITIGNNFKN